MWNWRDVFDQLDVQTSGLQRRDRAFATRSRTFDANFDVTHTKLRRLFGSLLCSALTGKRCALATALKPRGTSGRPAQRVTLGVSDRDRGVVER